MGTQGLFGYILNGRTMMMHVQFDANMLWKKAADLDHIDACIELAKYFEHQARDIMSALQWTHKGLILVEATIRSKYVRQQAASVLTHRLARLERKMDKTQETPGD